MDLDWKRTGDSRERAVRLTEVQARTARPPSRSSIPLLAIRAFTFLRETLCPKDGPAFPALAEVIVHHLATCKSEGVIFQNRQRVAAGARCLYRLAFCK